MKLEIRESSGHGKRVAGRKKTSTLQVVEPWPGNGYVILHQVRFTVGNTKSEAKAMRKAQDWLADNYGHVPIEEWGKDHWSLLGYIETCLVEPGGDRRIVARADCEVLKENQCAQLNLERMRINERRHPMHKVASTGEISEWKPGYGTRLVRFFESDRPQHKQTHGIASHDDWDCLEDMEREGLLEIISDVNAVVHVTEPGFKLMSQLRDFKAHGGNFYEFGIKNKLPASRHRVP